MTLQAISTAAANRIARQRTRIDNAATLLEALSPMATLRRGYSITRVNGHAVTSVNGLAPDTIMETTLADGTITSKISETKKSNLQ